MQVTKAVIRDLIPLYAAGDVSEDTKALVDTWLKTDDELAREVQALKDVLEPGVSMARVSSTSSGDDFLAQTLERLSRIQLVRFVVLVVSMFVLLIPVLYGTPENRWAFFTDRPLAIWVVFGIGLAVTLGAWLMLGAWQRSLIREIPKRR